MPDSASRGPHSKLRHRRSLVAFYFLFLLAAILGVVQPIASQVSYAASTSPTTLPSSASAPGSKRNVVTFGTQTATATKPDGRGIFEFAATPGGEVEDHVAIINYSNQTATFLMRGTDAVNTPQGGFAALPIDQRSKDVGTWIYLPKSDLSVTLGPRSAHIIPFLVQVPKNATPGDHIGVLTATLESLVESKSGQRVHLLQTVGTRMFIRVSGPLHPGFTVSGLKVDYQGTDDPIGDGKAILTYTVHNMGNVALGGRQTVYVSGLFGSKKTASHVAQVQLLLPGYSVKETVHLSGVMPELRDSGHVSISPLVIAGSVEPASGPYTATVSFWAIPWTLIAIILVVVVILVIWFLRRRRKRRPPVKGKDTPSAPTPNGAQAKGDSEKQVVRSGAGGMGAAPKPQGAASPAPAPAPVADHVDRAQEVK